MTKLNKWWLSLRHVNNCLRAGCVLQQLLFFFFTFSEMSQIEKQTYKISALFLFAKPNICFQSVFKTSFWRGWETGFSSGGLESALMTEKRIRKVKETTKKKSEWHCHLFFFSLCVNSVGQLETECNNAVFNKSEFEEIMKKKVFI